MATVKKQQTLDTQSVISWCGSASGNVSILVKSRRLSSKPSAKLTLPNRPAEVLAVKDLDRVSRTSIGLGPAYDTPSQCVVDIDKATGKERWHCNGYFHYYRFVVAIFGGLSCGIMLLHRYNMATAILQMVNQTHLVLEQSSANSSTEELTSRGIVAQGEFDWNNEVSARVALSPIDHINHCFRTANRVPYSITRNCPRLWPSSSAGICSATLYPRPLWPNGTLPSAAVWPYRSS